MVLPFLNVRFQCIHNDSWQANLVKHVSGHRKYRVSEIESMERWRDVFSAVLQSCGVGAGDSKSIFLHDAAVARPTGGSDGENVTPSQGRMRETVERDRWGS